MRLWDPRELIAFFDFVRHGLTQIVTDKTGLVFLSVFICGENSASRKSTRSGRLIVGAAFKIACVRTSSPIDKRSTARHPLRRVSLCSVRSN